MIKQWREQPCLTGCTPHAGGHGHYRREQTIALQPLCRQRRDEERQRRHHGQNIGHEFRVGEGEKDPDEYDPDPQEQTQRHATDDDLSTRRLLETDEHAGECRLAPPSGGKARITEKSWKIIFSLRLLDLE